MIALDLKKQKGELKVLKNTMKESEKKEEKGEVMGI